MNALLLQLRDKGNTVLVVEHKPETIAIADHVVDLGPGAGLRAAGPSASRAPSTGCAAAAPHGPAPRRPARLKDAVRSATGVLEVRGASTHNLRTWTSTSRSACCACSPAWPAPARARWSPARSPAATAWWSSTRAPIRGLAAQQPGDLHRACSSRCARRSRRPTA
jgi:hypothetical protein